MNKDDVKKLEIERILEHEKIRLELIEHLKESIMKNIDKDMIQTKQIYRIIYEFIFKKVFKDIKESNKKVDKHTWTVFKRTVDWSLNYGYIIREVLIFTQEFHDFIMQEKTSEQVQA